MLLNLLTIVVFLLMFSILVAAHELGHYLLARKFNMGVSEFSIGFGPILKTLKRKSYRLDDGEEGETSFNIRPIPLGGFVKILGMEPQEDGSEVNVNGGFYTKSPWARIVVLLAGPVFSIVFGWIILVGLYTTMGIQKPINRIQAINIGETADKAGMKPGDYIVSINNKPITDSIDAIMAIRHGKTGPVDLVLERDGTKIAKTVTPAMSKDEIEDIDEKGEPTGKKGHFPVLGIRFDSDFVRVPLSEAFVEATLAPYQAGKGMLEKIFIKPNQILEESTGVIGMAVSTRLALAGGIANVIFLSGLISISLGFMNLLPIGMLDGGQIFIAFIEALRGGRRLSLRSQVQFLYAGMALILFFFVAVTFKDLKRFVLPGKENLLQNTNTNKDSKTPDANTPAANAPVK